MNCLFALSRHRKYSACSLKLFLVVNVVIVVHNNVRLQNCVYFVNILTIGGVEDSTFEAKAKNSKKSEAKDRLFKDRPS